MDEKSWEVNLSDEDDVERQVKENMFGIPQSFHGYVIFFISRP